jgi:DNA-binding SARP family transcriptional activator
MEHERAAAARCIYLFGAVRVQDGRGLRPLSGRRAQTLLSFLALHPHASHRREALADLLAPDAPAERVRRNFADALYRLQKVLGPGWLAVDGGSVALHAPDLLWVDVWEFERLAGSDDDADLQRAVDLYAGDLLPELDDDWLLAPRALLRNRYLSTLEALASRREARGELQLALLAARRLVLAEPLHEAAHQLYMRLLGRLRRPSEALAHYAYLCELLRAELGAEPLAETQAIAGAIQREHDVASAPEPQPERTAFVGRIAERAMALAMVEAALGGRGGVLAIEGEAGIGKSRLLREVAASARWRGAEVLQGVAGETPAETPFAPLAHALAPLLGGPRAAQLESLLPGEALAALAPLHGPWRGLAALPDVTAAQAGARFQGALRLLGEALARLRPLVLALDDVQWASPALWECLVALAQGLVSAGGLLLLAYRRPGIEGTSGWDKLRAWDRDALLRTLLLPPLAVEEVAQLLGDDAPADAAEVHGLTGGSPLLIGEWLAEPTRERRALRDTVRRRLRELPDGSRAALECAAVLGQSVPYRLWAELVALPALALPGISEELAARRWLQPSAAGYSFAHELIREAVYDAAEPSRRRELHRRAAHAYRALEADNARAQAFHFDRADLREEAAHAYRQAGAQDIARFAFHEAQDALDRALALLPPDSTLERVKTALDLARTCENTGDRAREQAALEEALAGALSEEHEFYLLRTRLLWGSFATHTGQVGEAEKQLTEALALARRLGDNTRVAEAMVLSASLANEQSKWVDARSWASQALEYARASDSRYYEGLALRILGIVALTEGQFDEAIHWLERAIDSHRAIGERANMSITQTNLLIAFYELGAWDRLLLTAEELLPIKDAIGDRLGATSVRHNQALAYYALGDYAEARQILQRVLQDAEAVRSRRRMGLARNVLGLIAEDEGDDEGALAFYQEALADAEAVHGGIEAAYARHDLGALLVRLGRQNDAIPLLEEATAAWVEQGNLLLRVKSEAYLGLALLAAGECARAEELAESGWRAFQAGVPVGEQPQAWLWALQRLLAALGRHERTGVLVRAAYDELQRQARAIADPGRRSSFFEHVPLNRAIVAAHDQLAADTRVLSVSLARRDAPLGRTLHAHEFVTVRWTVRAPEDDALADKAERRRQRLRRLLHEAELQGAAPTDDDLARALGVSRRTILRDILAVGRAQRPATRKRKA